MKYNDMDIFTALSDPTRRGIVELLGQGPQAAGDITARFEVSAPAISQHLKVLKEAELVHVRIDGQRRIYSLNPQGLTALDDWLDRMRRFWSSSLDALEHELRKPVAKPKSKPRKSRGDQK